MFCHRLHFRPPMSHDEDDILLCEQAQRGSEEAFTCLFHRYYEAIRAFSFRLCSDTAGAEEITQEAFIKAARHLPTFRGDASFKNWLYQITLHTARDWQRRYIRRPQLEKALAQELATSDTARDSDFDPLYRALEELPEAHRQAVILVYYEGFDHREAAKILGCAEATISWRLFRARRHLKNALS